MHPPKHKAARLEPACRHRATGPSPGISTSAVTTGHRIDCPCSQARSRVPRLASICDILSLRFHELHARGPVAGLPAAASRLYDPKREINNPNVPSRPLPKRHDDSGLYQAACHLRRVLNARLWPLRRDASDRRGSGGSGRPRERKLGGYAGSAGEKRPALQPADQWRESLFWAPIAELRRKRSGHPGLASSHQCSADRYRSLSTQMPSSLRTEAGQDSSARSRIVRSAVRRSRAGFRSLQRPVPGLPAACPGESVPILPSVITRGPATGRFGRDTESPGIPPRG